jgi:xanthine dehydrogenase accessory factor
MKILIKGAGDLSTGISYRLKKSGYEIWMTDREVPTNVRRTVSFSRAIYEGSATVEGITARRANSCEEGHRIAACGEIPVFADPDCQILQQLKPDVLVDATVAKKHLKRTHITDAPLVIGIGPGFIAGTDCHVVVETQRGHDLGRLITEGEAVPNTGIPGDIGGFTTERIIRASAFGTFEPVAKIGDYVEKGQIVAYVNSTVFSSRDNFKKSFVKSFPVRAQMSGIVRGMLQPGVTVHRMMKAGDIDARCEVSNCFTISDKARALGGSVLEAVCAYEHNPHPDPAASCR